MDRKLLLPAIALALVSACSTDIPTPTAIEIVGLRPQAVKVLKGTSNKIKPSNTGKKPGTGGSGSSTLELSALLGMDGTTTIEASTGSLEDGTTNGTFSKMQLKLYALPDTFTLNYTGLTTGFWTTTDSRLERGDSVQGKGTIKPPAGKGTENVTVVTTVHLRPDIAVEPLRPPKSLLRGIPATFTAFVSELNEDRGARGDCILTVDGVDVDHADGIWVDAGKEVACVFAWTFATAGGHDVAIRVANVKPGDWDLANNSASVKVKVVHPVTPVATGYVSVREEHRHELVTTDTQRFTGSVLSHRHTEKHRADLSVFGQDPVAYAQPFQSVRATVLNDGALAYTNTMALALQQDLTLSDGSRSVCYGYHESGQHAIVCTWSPLSGPAFTYYNFVLTAGYTSFYGNNIYCAFGFCNRFESPQGSTSLGGNALGLGQNSIATIQLLATDAFGDGHRIDQTLPALNYSNLEQHSFLGCKNFVGSGLVPSDIYTACEWFDRDGYIVHQYVTW